MCRPRYIGPLFQGRERHERRERREKTKRGREKAPVSRDSSPSSSSFIASFLSSIFPLSIFLLFVFFPFSSPFRIRVDIREEEEKHLAGNRERNPTIALFVTGTMRKGVIYGSSRRDSGVGRGEQT